MASAVASALAAARRDLIAIIEDGIPDREYLAGTGDALPTPARLLIAAEKKTGKSIVIGVVVALRIIEAGGTVAVLDRENGEVEYARRLDSVLRAWDADDELRQAVRERFRYYAFPQVGLAWGEDPDYPAVFEGVDAVIFDSSRPMLGAMGLKENSSDDYDRFVQAIINPLFKAAVTTIILDNTGWDGGGRSRGTSAKGDLADVEYGMSQADPFNADTRGRVELRVNYSRFGEVFGTWDMEIGGGTYGQLRRTSARAKAAKQQQMTKRIVELLTAERLLAGGGLNGADIARRCERDKSDQTVRRALAKLVEADEIDKDDDGIYTVVVNDNGKVTT